MTTGRINQVTIICLVDWGRARAPHAHSMRSFAQVPVASDQAVQLAPPERQELVLQNVVISGCFNRGPQSRPRRQAPHLHLPTWVLPQPVMQKQSYYAVNQL